MFSSNGAHKGSKSLPYDKIFKIFKVYFHLFISGDSASHFLGMIMLIRLLDTLAQTNVRVDS